MALNTQFKNIKQDDMFGILEWKESIGVNTSLLWKSVTEKYKHELTFLRKHKSKSKGYKKLVLILFQAIEDEFISEFSKTYCHELLHQQIDEAIQMSRSERFEERIIRQALGEEWDKEIERQYEN